MLASFYSQRTPGTTIVKAVLPPGAVLDRLITQA